MNPLRQHYRKLLYSFAGILLLIYIFKWTGWLQWYNANTQWTTLGNLKLSAAPIDSAWAAHRKDIPVISWQDAVNAGDNLCVRAKLTWPYDTLIPGRIVLHAYSSGVAGSLYRPLFNSFPLSSSGAVTGSAIIKMNDGQLIVLVIGGSYASGGVASSTGILQGRDLLPLLYEKEQESAIAWCRQQTVLALHQLVSGPFSERRTFITTGGNNNGSFQHSSSVFHLEKLSPDNKRD